MIPLGDDTRRLPIFPIVTYALIALNVYVFALEMQAPDVDAFVRAYAAIPYNVTHGVQLAPPSPDPVYATLLTSMFLHGGVLHIAFNMLFLFVFGPDVEYLCGSLKFLAFYLLCGVIAGLTQILMNPGSHVPGIGASGAIAGVLGAYIVTYPTNRINTVVPIGCFPLFLQLPAVLVIGIWAVVQFVNGFGSLSSKLAQDQGGGTAYFAHIGGFLAGVFLIYVFRERVGTRHYRYYY